MTLSHSEFASIDAAIAEFGLAVADLFATPERREIELMKSRLATMPPCSRGRVVMQERLIAMMTQRLRRENAA